MGMLTQVGLRPARFRVTIPSNAGSFQITAYTTGGTTTEQPVINFAVIKAVTA